MWEYVVTDEYIGNMGYARDATAGCMLYRSLSCGTQGLQHIVAVASNWHFDLLLVPVADACNLRACVCLCVLSIRHIICVKSLHYKLAGRGFDSRWCHWNFSVT